MITLINIAAAAFLLSMLDDNIDMLSFLCERSRAC